MAYSFNRFLIKELTALLERDDKSVIQNILNNPENTKHMSSNIVVCSSGKCLNLLDDVKATWWTFNEDRRHCYVCRNRVCPDCLSFCNNCENYICKECMGGTPIYFPEKGISMITCKKCEECECIDAISDEYERCANEWFY